jgi:hypothetical protein
MINSSQLKLFFLALLIALIGLTAVPSPLLAQDNVLPGLNLTAVAGYDGYYKANGWIPVHITASNNGPAISGQLQIATGSAASNNRVTYATPIDLPTQSSKQVTLYVYLPTHTNRLSVELRDERGRLLHEAQTNLLRPLEMGALLYGLASGDGGRLAFLENVPGGRTETAVANLTISQLPDIPAALAPLDVLLFHDVDSGQLTPAQRDALTQWISLGGQLVVAGGPGWQQTVAGLSDLLPVTVQSSRSVDDLPALAAWAGTSLRDPGPYVTAVATLRRGEVIIQEGELPLLARHTYGRGAVYFLALDPTLSPLRDWDGNETLWAQIADNAPRSPGWGVGFQRNYAAAQAVQIIPGLSLPSIWLILLFMLGYIVLIGPVNYLLVWRLNRRELAWLTIPAIILLVSAGTYLVGTQLMGRSMVINQMSVAFGHVDSDAMRVQSLTAVYSPRRANYDLTMPGDVLARPFTQGYYGGSGIGQGGNVAAMERDTHLTARQARVDVGGLQNFVAEFQQPRPAFSGRVNLTIDGSGASLDIYLQNNESWTLEHGTLIYGDAVYPLGNLAGGGSYEGRQRVTAVGGLSTAPYTPYAYYASPAATLLSGNAEHFLGGSDHWSDQARFARYQLLESLSPDYSGGGVGHIPTGVATLVGWANNPQLQLAIDPGANRYKTFNSILYFIELPVTHTTAQESGFTLPRAMLTWRVLDSQGMGGSPGIPPFYMYTGRIDYEFEPVFQPNNGQVVSLQIALEATNPPGNQPMLNVYLWHWATSRWERVDQVDWGMTAVADHAPYIGPNYAVRLRLENETAFGYDIEEIYPVLEFR